MATFKKRNDKLEECPFTRHHKVKTSSLQSHITKCPRNPRLGGRPSDGDPVMEPCVFNATHYVEVGKMDEHLATCRDGRYDLKILLNADKEKPDGLAGILPLAHHTYADNGENWDDSNEPPYVIPALAGAQISLDPEVPIDKLAYQYLRPAERKWVDNQRMHNLKEKIARRELANGSVIFEEPASVTSPPPSSADSSLATSSSSDGSDSVFYEGKFADYGIRRPPGLAAGMTDQDPSSEVNSNRIDSQGTTILGLEDGDESCCTNDEPTVTTPLTRVVDDEPNYVPFGMHRSSSVKDSAEHGDGDAQDGLDEGDVSTNVADTTVLDADISCISEANESVVDLPETTLIEKEEDGSVSSIGSSASHSERYRLESQLAIKRKTHDDLNDSGFATRKKMKSTASHPVRDATDEDRPADISF